METVEIGAELRSDHGSSVARRTRRQGKTPGVFYGPKRESTKILIDSHEFLKQVAALEGSHLIRFRSTAETLADKVALVKEAQYHPVNDTLLHCDFYEVDMTQKLRVDVPLHFTGRAAGVAAGGILQPLRRDIEVECLPSDIPEFIDVDVTALQIHQTVHVRELQLPNGVEGIFDTDFTIVTVLPPTVEEAKPAEAEEEAAAAEEGAAPAEAPKEEAAKTGEES
jgi:large subunit ribosomal protein L25